VTRTAEQARAEYRPPSLLSVCRVRAGVELKSFLREREAVVFTFAFPILLLVIFGAVFGRQDVEGGVTFAQVFVAGMIAAGLLGSSFQNLAIAIPIERDSGALKRLAGTPMPRSAYFVGKIALVAVVAVVQQILLLAIGVAFYGLHLPTEPSRWITYLWVSVLGISACTLLGIAATSFVKNGKTAPRGDLADRDRAAVHLRRVLRLLRAADVDADDRRVLPAEVDDPGDAVGLPAGPVRGAGAGRVVGARPDRAGAGDLTRGRAAGRGPHVPLAEQGRRVAGR
jgi:ABC-type transport system involved in cytochrome c biogenesis permease component